MRIIDNLYAYEWGGNDNNCNSYVFAHALSDGRHVIIDPGHRITPIYHEPGLERLSAEMQRDGIADHAFGLIILTHGHPDHCESAVSLREYNHSLVAIHEADEAMYRSMGGEADIYLEEGTLELGSGAARTLHILHSPGHSPGHITVYWPERNVLIAGDCIFYRSTGRVDLPGGDAAALGQTIEKLSRLEIDYLLCGHAYGNPGILIGKEDVRENFRIIKQFFN